VESMDNKNNVCPICKDTKNSVLYAPANFDFNKINEFGFASRKMPEYMHYTIKKCNCCDILYAVDTLDQDALKKLYQNASYDSGNEAKYASKTYVKYLNKYTQSNKKSGTIDIGTGEGSFLKLLIEEGYKEVYGIEPSIEPINQADKEIKELIINDIFKKEYCENKEINLITCFQTLEHICNPQSIVNDIYESLADGGEIYTVCHGYNSLVNKMLKKKSPIFDIEHLQLFSSKSIKKLLLNAGFSEVRTFKIYNKYPLSYWVKLFPLPNSGKKKLLKFLSVSRIGKILIPINVGNIGAIAKKKL
jgi:SAM-dependent methyltransferase